MYWWHIAADTVRTGKANRFGFITTNSIKQTFNRRVIQAHLEAAKDPLSVAFAIPDHPWVDAADGAAVRIAMTVGALDVSDGRLLTVTQEQETSQDGIEVAIIERLGYIFADLSIGANTASCASLKANENLSNRGVSLFGAGFIVTPEETRSLGYLRINDVEP